jgi:hypothetical protein
MPPTPESGSIVECVKSAFRLEEIYGDRTVYEALQMVTNPPDGIGPVDKGWLLAVSTSLAHLQNIARC